MTSEITIVKIPREKVYAAEFAALEGVSLRTVRRWTTGENPCLPIEARRIKKGKRRATGRVRILYAQWKERQVREALGHSRFQIIVGA
ncbi:hypothetical protein ACFSFZ_20465 [Mixta tenebrionis]|uniref:Uncharacterized protein n=1 Tax=Mixta tenebrionis TaxID=2562439 RepID=A0A506V5X2_9GAMM|nr:MULTISPECIES: hypothetical protein [Mixta]QHM74091.1 hypothetical protein C7M52_00012 [Mixta theicola]TPW41068.1 hypothetical protein FKM52_16385 [Mixta tenebrionis]